MARGWESKSVEEQIEALNNRVPQSIPPSASEAERDSVLLQRRRIQALMESSANPRYVEQQRKALAFLDVKLEKIESEKF